LENTIISVPLLVLDLAVVTEKHLKKTLRVIHVFALRLQVPVDTVIL